MEEEEEEEENEGVSFKGDHFSMMSKISITTVTSIHRLSAAH